MITDAELVAMKERVEEKLANERPVITFTCDETLRLLREVEELRAALRELHEAASETEKWVFSYRDYAGKWRSKLRDALSKARAALGDDHA